MSQAAAPRPVDQGIAAAIRRAAQATGVDFDLLVQTARRESAFDPNARARTSSATGLFQFIDSAWLDMVRRHGRAHGLGTEAALLQSGRADAAARREILKLRTDPELSARLAGELARENAASLAAKLGRAPSAGELYAAHVLGAGGAGRLIEAAAAGAGDAAQLFPREAGANRGLFFTRDGAPLSAAGVLDRLGLETKSAAMRNDAAPARASEAQGPLSPALAEALFALALMPLRREESEGADGLWRLSAYQRAAKR